ncbi:TVG0325598 [Thermoplasma volcanium GSS1]|uniref:TVG0325598 protein n=1 Tax=Thermoplasma volcanium (strain ATCC 51530 / DSM 4299 / JCM 9571 / NBRC 15438 / GSS1) TaxID=273116 RepID=Q97BY6_THEVO|nr:TVG0325598 [Thermoplasma volcanium GSS1]
MRMHSDHFLKIILKRSTTNTHGDLIIILNASLFQDLDCDKELKIILNFLTNNSKNMRYNDCSFLL